MPVPVPWGVYGILCRARCIGQPWLDPYPLRSSPNLCIVAPNRQRWRNWPLNPDHLPPSLPGISRTIPSLPVIVAERSCLFQVVRRPRERQAKGNNNLSSPLPPPSCALLFLLIITPLISFLPLPYPSITSCSSTTDPLRTFHYHANFRLKIKAYFYI